MIPTFKRRALFVIASSMSLLAIAAPACRSIVGIPGGDITIVGEGGAGGAGGKGGAGQGGTDAGPLVPTCAEYCDTVQAGCTAENAVYFSPAACAAMCPFIPPGNFDDDMMNTVGCKLGLARLAKDNNDVDGCKGAGPAGNNLCGTNCDAYCALLDGICHTQLVDHFGTVQQCLSDCMNIPDTKTYTAVDNTLPTDDSIQCRIRHLNSAALGGAATHCMHAVGVGQCPLVTDGGTGDAGDAGDGG